MLTNIFHQFKNSKVWTKVMLFSPIVLFLASCSSGPKGPAYTKEQRQNLDRFLKNLDNQGKLNWGAKELLFSPHELVKFSDEYLTRSVVNFSSGQLKFETLNPNYRQALKNEIIYTVLMSSRPNDDALYDTGLPYDISTPFLANQLVDQNKQPIRSIEQAINYANYLLGQGVRTRTSASGKTVYYLTANLIKNHVQARANTYRPLVMKYANRYNIDYRLMLAIMEVESAFNPYAKSHSGAIGLMQIVPTTAGTDAFRFLGKSGKPTRDYLYQPENNIEMAAVYINIMSTRYFQNIKNPVSKRYMMIASYNAGPGGTLTVFNRDRAKAIDVINRMSPREVYNQIFYRHYSDQARRYLYKVENAFKKY